MTRDEAIKIVARGGLPTDPVCVGSVAFVDILRYLGVLKLDEIAQEPVMALCHEDPDWNWWLNQTVAFKAAAVKQIRARPVPDNGEGALQKLIDGCRGVPYLATAINETLERAGLRIVEK